MHEREAFNLRCREENRRRPAHIVRNPQLTLQRHVSAKTVDAPPLQKVGGVNVRLWSARDIEKTGKLSLASSGKKRRKHKSGRTNLPRDRSQQRDGRVTADPQGISTYAKILNLRKYCILLAANPPDHARPLSRAVRIVRRRDDEPALECQRKIRRHGFPWTKSVLADLLVSLLGW